MFQCNNCNCRFDEPKVRRTSYEAEFGVSNLFPNSTPWNMQVCPKCGDDDFEELMRCDACDEWVKEEDLQSVDGMENIDFVCPKCFKIYGE